MLEIAADPLAFENWVQVAALAVLVLGAIFYKQLDGKAKATQEDVTKIVNTLTTNNGGSHVKDSLDRLEKQLAEHIKWSEEYVRDVDTRMEDIESVVSPIREDEVF